MKIIARGKGGVSVFLFLDNDQNNWYDNVGTPFPALRRLPGWDFFGVSASFFTPYSSESSEQKNNSCNTAND